MNIAAPVRRENLRLRLAHFASLCWLLAAGLLPSVANAQDPLRLEAIDVQPLPGQQVELRLRLNGAAPEPMAFTIDDPARISLDLPNTTLALDSRRQEANVGPLTTVLAAEANGRTRVVLNLATMVPYQTRVEGDSVYVLIGQGPGETAAPAFTAQPSQRPSPAARSAVASGDRSIRNIDFRRGADGSGQVVVELNDPRTTVDVRQEGGRIVVDFQDTTLPQELMRRLDVTDFATPVFTVDALRANQDSRLVVTAAAEYDQSRSSSSRPFSKPLRRRVSSTRTASTRASDSR
jgi:type IV pilus assembly protein PilQ